jgi:hypothetical protein
MKLKLIYDRQSVGQSVLVSGTHLGPVTNFFFLLEISFRQLRVCYFVAPSLTRGRVCNLLVQLILGLARAITLGRSPAELQVPVFIFPGNRVAQLYPKALGSLFVASCDSQGYGESILTRLHTGL